MIECADERRGAVRCGYLVIALRARRLEREKESLL